MLSAVWKMLPREQDYWEWIGYMLVDSFKEEVQLNWKWSLKIEWGLTQLMCPFWMLLTRYLLLTLTYLSAKQGKCPRILQDRVTAKRKKGQILLISSLYSCHIFDIKWLSLSYSRIYLCDNRYLWFKVLYTVNFLSCRHGITPLLLKKIFMCICVS